MEIVHFKLNGKFGHFLYAETNVSMPTYPIPPRTTILGLIGAILGLKKDSPQVELEPAYIAVSGKLPERFWVTNKFHQSLPSLLNLKILKSEKGSVSRLKNQKILNQEWLFKPEYEIWAGLPETYHSEFAGRIKDRKWHFQPYLGITEHSADIEWISDEISIQLKPGDYYIESIFPEKTAEIKMDYIINNEFALHFVRMPKEVSCDRVFIHENYFFERNAKAVYVNTKNACKIGKHIIIFM